MVFDFFYRLRTHFFAPGLVFCRFWPPGRSSKITKNRLLKKFSDDFLAPEIVFLCFLRSGAFRKGPGPVPEAPGTLPDQILPRFCDTFSSIPSGSCRVFSGSAGMLPGSASNLGNPLSGVPLGYGDLAQRFKFAVLQRGAGVVLDESVKSPVPEGFPFLTFPAASARPPTLPVEAGLASVF